MSTVARHFRVLGSTEDHAGCDCCGRMNLKRYVVLEPVAGGEVLYYGTTCAARAEGMLARDIAAEARTAETAKRDAARAERLAELAAAEQVYLEWARGEGATVDTFGNVGVGSSGAATPWALRTRYAELESTVHS